MNSSGTHEGGGGEDGKGQKSHTQGGLNGVIGTDRVRPNKKKGRLFT